MYLSIDSIQGPIWYLYHKAKKLMMKVVIIQYYTRISLDTLPSCQVCDYQHCISTDTEEVIYLIHYESSFGHIYVPDIRRC